VSALQVVLLVVLVLLVLLFAGGYVANRRHFRAEEAQLRRQIEEANERLAAARAEDKGWDRETMEAAVREAVGGPVQALELVQVVDNPGTDADEAVFRVQAAGGAREVVLGRRDGAWVAR
jgi:nitrogen fixation protein FixH